MEIKLKDIEEENLKSVFELFEDRRFFFKTKRPESLYEGNIKALVLNDDEKTFLIYCDNELEGLISVEKDIVEEGARVINLRLKNMKLIVENIWEFSAIINKDLDLNGVNIIKMKIYDFDDIGKLVCEKLKFNIEACLKKRIYKNNKYNDVIIYSKKIIGGDIFD